MRQRNASLDDVSILNKEDSPSIKEEEDNEERQDRIPIIRENQKRRKCTIGLCALVCSISFLGIFPTQWYYVWGHNVLLSLDIDKHHFEGISVCVFFIFPMLLASLFIQRTIRFPKRVFPVFYFGPTDLSDLLFWLSQLGVHILWFGFNLYRAKLAGKIRKKGLLKCVGRALGKNALIALFLVLLPSTPRIYLFKSIGYERSIQFHKWLGTIVTICLLFHGIFYYVVWLRAGEWTWRALPCTDCDSKTRYKSYRNFYGLVGLVCAVLLQITSMKRFLSYKWFYSLHHVFLWALLLASSLHYSNLHYWVFPSLSLYMLYRMRSFVNRQQVGVARAFEIANGFLRIEFFRMNNDFQVGQFLYLRMPPCSSWHPFSISSSPLRPGNTFTIDLQVEGAFTRQLQHLIKEKQLNNVEMDGFYGATIELHEHVMLIAGGIGGTPLLGLLEHILYLPLEQRPKRMTFIWASRNLQLLHAWAELYAKATERVDIQLYFTGAVEEEFVESNHDQNMLSTCGEGYYDKTRSKERLFTFLVLILSYIPFQFWVLSIVSPWWLFRTGGILTVVAGSIVGYCIFRRIMKKEAYASLPSETELDDTSIIEKSTPKITSGRPDIKREIEVWHRRQSGTVIVSGPNELISHTKSVCATLDPPVLFQTKTFIL